MTRSSDYFVTAIKKLFLIGSGLAASALIARFLGPAMRAEYAYLVNISAILVVVINFGLSSSYQSKRREHGVSACIEFVAVTLRVALFFGMAVLVLNEVIEWSNELALLIACFSLLRLQLQAVSLVENIKGSAFSSMIGGASEVIAVLICWFFLQPAVIWVVACLMIKEVIVGMLSLIAIVNAPSRPNISISQIVSVKATSVILNSLKYSMPMFILNVSNIVLYRIGVLLLGLHQIANGRVGIFVVGVLIAEYLWIFSDIFKDVQVSRTARGGGARDVAFAHRCALFVTATIYMLFAVGGYFATILTFGEPYAESYQVAVLMLAANVFMIPAKILGSWLISVYDVRLFVYGMVLAVFINITMCLLLIPVLGIYGAVVSSITSYFVPGATAVAVFIHRTRISLGRILFISLADLHSIANAIRRRRGEP